MDPEVQKQVERAQRILAAGAPGLSDDERGRLQTWVDSFSGQAAGKSPETGGESLTPDEIDVGDTSPEQLDAPGGILPELGRKVLAPAMTAAEHFVDKASFGVGTKLAEVLDPGYGGRAQAREAESPIAAGAGDVGGYMLGAGPKLAAHGVGGAIRAIPRMGGAASAASKMAGPATTGLLGTMAREGVVGAAEGAAIPLIEAGVDQAFGDETENLSDQMLSGATWGGILGSGIGAIGHWAGVPYHGLRDPVSSPKIAPKLRTLESGGGTTKSPSLSGLKAPEGYDDMARQWKAKPDIERPEVVSEIGLEPAGRATQRAISTSKPRLEAKHTKEAARYYASPEGRAGVEATETIDEVIKEFARREQTAFAPSDGRLLEYVDKMVETRTVPRGAAPPPGPVHKVSIDEARRLLPEESIQAAMASSGQAPGSSLAQMGEAGVDVYLVPKKISAESFDDMAQYLQELKKKDPSASKWQRALLRDRDKFQSNSAAPAPRDPVQFPDGTESRSGWTALKKRQESEILDLEAGLSSSGLRASEGVKEGAGEQLTRITDAIRQMQTGSRSVRDKFLAQLIKNNPEARGEIRRYLAARAFEGLQGAGIQPRGGLTHRGGVYGNIGGGANILRFNLDPVFRQAMIRGTGERGAHAAQFADDFARWLNPESSGQPITTEDLMSLMRQATAEEGE